MMKFREATPRVGQSGPARHLILRVDSIHRAVGVVYSPAPGPPGELFPPVAERLAPTDPFLGGRNRPGCYEYSPVAPGSHRDPRRRPLSLAFLGDGRFR